METPIALLIWFQPICIGIPMLVNWSMVVLLGRADLWRFSEVPPTCVSTAQIPISVGTKHPLPFLDNFFVFRNKLDAKMHFDGLMNILEPFVHWILPIHQPAGCNLILHVLNG